MPPRFETFCFANDRIPYNLKSLSKSTIPNIYDSFETFCFENDRILYNRKSLIKSIVSNIPDSFEALRFGKWSGCFENGRVQYDRKSTLKVIISYFSGSCIPFCFAITGSRITANLYQKRSFQIFLTVLNLFCFEKRTCMGCCETNGDVSEGDV